MKKDFPSRYRKEASPCSYFNIGQNRFPPKDKQKNMEGHRIVIKEKSPPREYCNCKHLIKTLKLIKKIQLNHILTCTVTVRNSNNPFSTHKIQ